MSKVPKVEESYTAKVGGGIFTGCGLPQKCLSNMKWKLGDVVSVKIKLISRDASTETP